MTVLRAFPRWLQVLLLAVNTAGSLLVLAVWWTAIWPNLAAGWVAAPTVVGPGLALLRASARRLEAHRRAIRTDLAEHHEKVTAHVAAQFAALHARLDQDGGTP